VSTLNQACIIVSEAGCYASTDIDDEAEFNYVDRNGRVAAAADMLVDWVKDWLADRDPLAGYETDGPLVALIARLVARAMAAQYEFGEQEHARREPPRLSISPAAAEALTALINDLVEEGGEANV
jgi:hypothetical protein